MDISCAFDMVWHPALFSKLSSYMVSKAISKVEFYHPPFLTRLEFLKVAFWVLFFFWFSSMISPTLWKLLYISLLMTPPSAVPSVIPQIGKQQHIHSLQIWIKTQAGQTRGTCFYTLTNLILSLCLSEWTV